MGRFESMNIHWPPVGWPQFAAVGSSTGRAVAKDISKAKIFGLQYSIESVPLFKMDTKLFRHDILIEGWEYTILNESIEYPVLSFSLYDRFDLTLAKECFVTDIRSYSTPMPHTQRSVNRAVNAAIFMIRQIKGGVVPDVNRILTTYKIHPNQAPIYQKDAGLDAQMKQAFDDEFFYSQTWDRA